MKEISRGHIGPTDWNQEAFIMSAVALEKHLAGSCLRRVSPPPCWRRML